MIEKVEFIFDYLTAKNIKISENLFNDDFKSYSTPLTLFSFKETLDNLKIKSSILNIPLNEITLLPGKFVTILRNNSSEFSFVYVKMYKGKYSFKMENMIFNLDENQLEERWLGQVLLINEKLKASSIENKMLPKCSILPNKNTKVIGFGNSLIIKGSLNEIFINIIGNNNEIIFKKNTEVFNCYLYFRGNNNRLEIGKNCRIKNTSFRLEDSNSIIKFGKFSTIESGNISATESKKIIVGKNCMFSNNISILTSDSHSILDAASKKRLNPAGDIIIDSHVWINRNTSILKNVSVGCSSIISTGSIVTKNVPSNAIVAGVPAKVIKTNVSWSRQLIKDFT